jgi:hypothetical protein
MAAPRLVFYRWPMYEWRDASRIIAPYFRDALAHDVPCSCDYGTPIAIDPNLIAPAS